MVATAARERTNRPAPGASDPDATAGLGKRSCAGSRGGCARNGVPSRFPGIWPAAEKFSISHETIYRHVWRDLRQGGTLHLHLRCARKQCRKRYGRYDSRGRLAGKRRIGERPVPVEKRQRIGPWEIDTMMGQSLGESSDCILTLVERKTGYLLMGKMAARTAEQARAAAVELMARHPGRFATITADNGTEFHSYPQIEAKTGVKFTLCDPASLLGERNQ